MKLLTLALGASLAFAAACATTSADEEARPAEPAAGQTPEETGKETGTANDDPDIVCESIAVTGSRIKKKRCTTRAQREKTKEGAQEFMRRTQRRGGTGAPGG